MLSEFVRGITSADIISSGLKNAIQPGEVNELDERMPEELCCSKLGFYLIFEKVKVLNLKYLNRVVIAFSRVFYTLINHLR